MDEILKIDTIDRYNKLFGFETRHPLVGVVRFDTAESQGNYRMTMGFYSVFLKETRGCRINYGKTGYDFDDQTVVSIAPGQTVGYTFDQTGPKVTTGVPHACASTLMSERESSRVVLAKTSAMV